MAKSEKRTFILLLISVILGITNIITNKIYNEYIYIGFWFVLFILLVILTGMRKDNYLYKKDILQQVFIYSFLYLIIIYICGIFTGFLKTGNSLVLIGIAKNIAPIIILVILEEVVRYSVMSKEKTNKINAILIVILLVIFDIIMALNEYGFTNFVSGLKMVALIILPSLAKNVLMTFLVTRGGYKPTMLYRLITEISLYLLPIFPDFGNYIKSVINFVFPMLLFIRFNKLYVKNKNETSRSRSLSNKIKLGIIISLTVIIVYLISGMFRFYALTIATGSMTPNINVGDVVIIKKVKSDELESLKVGDVLAHSYGNATIVHRIVEIEKDGERYYFKTKGDNNENEDSYITTNDKVIGKSVLKIRYIGYPSVWLSYLLK